MSERFAAHEGEVWDQTTVPHRKLDLDEARALVQSWAEKANEYRARSQYQQASCWSKPAAVLRAAISQAETQRRAAWMLHRNEPLR